MEATNSCYNAAHELQMAVLKLKLCIQKKIHTKKSTLHSDVTSSAANLTIEK
jgi:hypothetical protein